MKGQRRSIGDDDDHRDFESKNKKKKVAAAKVAEGDGMVSADAKAIGGGGGGDCVAEGGELIFMARIPSCEEWRWATAGEEMWWGSIWEPFWDVEFVGEAYNALFGDVVWDMDVWNLNAINFQAAPSS